MTLAGLRARLRRAGATAEVEGSRLVVTGYRQLSAEDREAVRAMRRLLREQAEEAVPAQPERAVVGQRCVGERQGVPVWQPLYADELREWNPSTGGLVDTLARLGGLVREVARPVSQWPAKRTTRGGARFRK